MSKPVENCSDYKTFEGLYKAYADCNHWCRERCLPPTTKSPALTPEQVEKMLSACVQECKLFQAWSPAQKL